MLHSLSFAAIGLFSIVLAQHKCDGGSIAEASQLTGYPKVLTKATIQSGDDDARELYNAILGTNASALAFPPFSTDQYGTPLLGDYDWRDDPYCTWSWTQCHTPKVSDLPTDFYFCPANTWGLSIDDGPTCAHDQLYAMFKEQNQLASLYYIGGNVFQWPEAAQSGYLNGHQICVHTWSHHAMTTLTNEQVFAELYYTKKIIKQVTGVTPRCWRPPYGDVDDRVRTIAYALDLRTHSWNHDTDDFDVDVDGQAAIVSNYDKIFAADHSQTGFVVLTHEVESATCNLLIQQYPHIQENFAHIAPVSSCNNDTEIFAEDDAELFPDFAAYLNGQRPTQRDNGTFWATDDMDGDGVAAQLYNTDSTSSQSASLASSSFASSLASTLPSTSAIPSTSASVSASASAAASSAVVHVVSSQTTSSASTVRPFVLLSTLLAFAILL